MYKETVTEHSIAHEKMLNIAQFPSREVPRQSQILKYSWLFTFHDPVRGSGQETFEKLAGEVR